MNPTTPVPSSYQAAESKYQNEKQRPPRRVGAVVSVLRVYPLTSPSARLLSVSHQPGLECYLSTRLLHSRFRRLWVFPCNEADSVAVPSFDNGENDQSLLYSKPQFSQSASSLSA